MRVLFSSTRGTGHVQPLLPYARALSSRGHEVLVAAPVDLSALLREAELPHALFDHPGDEALAPIWARLHEVSKDEANTIAISEIFAGVNARTALPRLLEIMRTWKPDIVVRDSVEFGSLVAAERTSIPHVRVAVHLPSFEEPIAPLAAASLNRLQLSAGLAPDDGLALRTETVFSAFPASMDGAIPLAGAPPHRWRLPESKPSTAKPTWASLDAGDGERRPLIYITFGTLVGTSPRVRSVYRTALDAVADLPVRALLTTGRGLPADALGAVPANVQVQEWVPQNEVLPHVRAVVCHGGSGTVLGTLAAGVPLIVVPLFADQPYNARRIEAVGAGLALPDADVGALRGAIERVLNEPAFGTGARRIADEIAALPPLDDAVGVLTGLASAEPSRTS